jgi:hypothetical protein
MSETDFGDWHPMDTAPRDGTRILVAIRGSEQGPAEVDVARWARPERSREPCWIAADSDAEVAIIYEEAEISSWMPLPDPMPKLKRLGQKRLAGDPGEIEGSGI